MTCEQERAADGILRRSARRVSTIAVIAIAIGTSISLGSNTSRAEEVASTVTWDDQTLALVKSGDATRGSALATQCKACHGRVGLSDAGLMPTLAGMNPLTTYKQLQDFHGYRRPWKDMNQISRLLSPQDMADLAAYWASLPGLGKEPSGDPASPAGKLALEGNADKGIPPCTSCHTAKGNEMGAPPLAGQNAAYIEQQLVAFATGLRHNDLDGQMRDIAGNLTPEDRHAIAIYFSATKP